MFEVKKNIRKEETTMNSSFTQNHNSYQPQLSSSKQSRPSMLSYNLSTIIDNEELE